jgi:DNA-binding HxlR family transcriptional regulator
MSSYGQFCPITLAAEVFCERWNPVIIREIMSGSHRFSQIQKGAPLMSPSLLTKRLKELESAGVIERQKATMGKSYEYHLTEAGRELEPMVMALGIWGRRWVARTLPQEQLDIGLLMWDMRRTVQPGELPTRPSVIHFHYNDSPKRGPDWWLVCDEKDVELCMSDPGFDVDLYVFTDSVTMTGIWRGDMSLNKAVNEGTLELQGSTAVRRKFNAFLGERPWVGIGSRLKA